MHKYYKITGSHPHIFTDSRSYASLAPPDICSRYDALPMVNVLVLADFDNYIFQQMKACGMNIRRHITKTIDDVDVLVVRSNTNVNRGLVKGMPQLKCVITATHGKDHIDEEYLRSEGIDLFTVPVQFRDVAQGVMAYILAFSTNLIEANRLMKQCEWRKTELIGFRIQDKTLGIVGYGRIGREVGRLASQLGMKVIIYDPFITPQTLHNVTIAQTLEELLEISEFVTIHVPLTAQTQGMIGERELRVMKPHAYLINTSRGGIVDEAALLHALNKGRLAGAGLDVYECHHPWHHEGSKELVEHNRVISTPHSIGQTREALREKGEAVITIIKQWIASY